VAKQNIFTVERK